MVVALDELIIFAIHGNFPKRLFRAGEVLKVCKNMQKMTFLLFQVGMGYGVRKMTERAWRVILVLRSNLQDLFYSIYPYHVPNRFDSLCFIPKNQKF